MQNAKSSLKFACKRWGDACKSAKIGKADLKFKNCFEGNATGNEGANVMNFKDGFRQAGVPATLIAAVLFGAGAPLSKLLLNTVNPWMLAGLLYLGSGLGLALYRLLRRAPAVSLPRNEMLWFAAAVVAGGGIAPVLLLMGLHEMLASSASLLLNAEGVFTTLLAWFAFKENFNRRVALGMIFIMAGAVILSWPTEIHFSGLWPAMAVLGACLAWGIDNNLTRKVSLADATWVASIKGLAAGMMNLVLAICLGISLPPIPNMAAAMVVGFFAYGLSLALFVVGLRHLGTARTSAYFSIAPFFGVLISVITGEPVTIPLLMAGALMTLGIWLHLTEHHEHEHLHELMDHSHEHVHDDHHQHEHDEPIEPGMKHTHRHRHQMAPHSHAHFPDMHHQHGH